MVDRYRLGRLGNEQLLSALNALVRQENEATSDLLAHLAELDERRLYADLGFPSLFAYCTEALGLSESSAGRRITAARVGRRFPSVFAAVARGELNLSILCALNPYLNQENAAELLKACSGKKRQQVEEILAARFPRPDVRESRIEALAVDRYGVHFTADGEFRELLETARDLVSHRVPTGNIADVMRLALKALISDAEKKRFAVGRKPRRSQARVEGPAAEVNSLSPDECADNSVTTEALPVQSDRGSRTPRRIPAAVMREVYVRDEGRCSFVSHDGRRCNSRGFIELDHAEPWAVGGRATLGNLRLRCRAHNQLYARRYFGKAYISAAVARQRQLSARATRAL